MRLFAKVLIVAILAVIAALYVAHAEGSTPLQEGTSPPYYQARLVELINGDRVLAHVGLLTVDSALAGAALGQAVELARRDTCSHYDVAGDNPVQRMRLHGYPRNPAWWGEVVACRVQNVADAVDRWEASPEHAAILVEQHYTAIGCGWAGNDSTRKWAVCDFTGK